MSSSVRQTVLAVCFLVVVITHNAILASRDDQCRFETQEGQIINLHESKDLGAKMLGALEMKSLDRCTEACCGGFYGECNMAFYHEKAEDGRNCFLALCDPPEVCKLTAIDGFSATQVIKIDPSQDADWFLTTFLNHLEQEVENNDKAATPSDGPLVDNTTQSAAVTELTPVGPEAVSISNETDLEANQHAINHQPITTQKPVHTKQTTAQQPTTLKQTTKTTTAKQTTLPVRTAIQKATTPQKATTQQRVITTQQATATQKTTTPQKATTTQRAITTQRTTTLHRTAVSEKSNINKPTEPPAKQPTESLETFTNQPGETSGSPVSKGASEHVASTTQAILEPQDSRDIELPGGVNETAASLDDTKDAKGISVTSYLSSNGALVAAICFGVLFVTAGVIIVAKRWYEGYQRRHYNKMDYLINGMYN